MSTNHKRLELPRCVKCDNIATMLIPRDFCQKHWHMWFLLITHPQAKALLSLRDGPSKIHHATARILHKAKLIKRSKNKSWQLTKWGIELTNNW